LTSELLTGKRVFQCKNDNIEAGLELVKKALIPDPLTLRADLPADVAATLNRCLHRDPEKRYASAMDCVLDLEHSIYSKGYGLTIKKLAMYIESLGGWDKAHPAATTATT
jgi:serine/threonine protein kinase